MDLNKLEQASNRRTDHVAVYLLALSCDPITAIKQVDYLTCPLSDINSLRRILERGQRVRTKAEIHPAWVQKRLVKNWQFSHFKHYQGLSGRNSYTRFSSMKNGVVRRSAQLMSVVRRSR